MRLEETNSHEKWLTGITLGQLQSANGFVSDLAISIGIVRHIGIFKCSTSGQIRWFLIFKQCPFASRRLIFFQRITNTIGFKVRYGPGSVVFMIPMAYVKDLAHGFRTISIGFKELRKSDCIRARFTEIRAKIVNSQRLWPQ